MTMPSAAAIPALMRAEVSTPLQFSIVKEHGEKDGPGNVGNFRHEVHGRAAAPDDADQRVDDVIENKTPAGDVAETGMDFLADVKESRAAVRIDARHAAVADRGEEHRDHGEQNDRDDVSARFCVEDAEDRHRCSGLNEDDSVEDQIPEAQCCA